MDGISKFHTLKLGKARTEIVTMVHSLHQSLVPKATGVKQGR